jgi:hypothetical protein
MQVDGRIPIGQRKEDVVIHSVTANIGIVTALFISFFEGQMFARWIVTKILLAEPCIAARLAFLAEINSCYVDCRSVSVYHIDDHD